MVPRYLLPTCTEHRRRTNLDSYILHSACCCPSHHFVLSGHVRLMSTPSPTRHYTTNNCCCVCAVSCGRMSRLLFVTAGFRIPRGHNTSLRWLDPLCSNSAAHGRNRAVLRFLGEQVDTLRVADYHNTAVWARQTHPPVLWGVARERWHPGRGFAGPLPLSLLRQARESRSSAARLRHLRTRSWCNGAAAHRLEHQQRQQKQRQQHARPTRSSPLSFGCTGRPFTEAQAFSEGESRRSSQERRNIPPITTVTATSVGCQGREKPAQQQPWGE